MNKGIVFPEEQESKEQVTEDMYKEVDTEDNKSSDNTYKEVDEDGEELSNDDDIMEKQMMKMMDKMDKMTDLILSDWGPMKNISSGPNVLDIIEKLYKFDIMDNEDYVNNLIYLLNLQNFDIDNGRLQQIENK